MKSVLISIQPKWCEKIISAEKTVEVRKTKPKLKTPFKCYVYCTQGKLKYLGVIGNSIYQKRMTVIGEFVCDKVYETEKMFVCGNDGDMTLNELKEKSCLSGKEMNEYANGRFIYGWNISNLIIYDEPKQLSSFHSKKQWTYYRQEWNIEGMVFYPEKRHWLVEVKKAPQDWCYVEE